MSSAPRLVPRAPGPEPAGRPVPAARGAPATVRAGRNASRIAVGWARRIGWAFERTGRAGAIGITLLLATAVFVVSTHLRVVREVGALRAEAAEAGRRARSAPAEARPDAAAEPRTLPPRTAMPALLREIFTHASDAQLAVESGKYEVVAATAGGIVRHHVAFPVKGPYARVRGFLDDVLAAMPAVAVRDLALERKAVGDGVVEARIRLTVYTTEADVAPVRPADSGATPAVAAASRGGIADEPGASGERVAAARDATALFAAHAWRVIPVVPLPPPPQPVAPSAPPFPYAFLGSYAPDGAARIYFLAKSDRVLDARVGDRIDGVYQFESADDAQLVFTYLPLDVRQTLATGALR